MIKVLQVGGKWDDAGGKTSGYANKLFNELNQLWTLFGATPIMANGGDWETLTGLLNLVASQDIVIWFADCPNDKPKLVERIKEINPKCILITSKYNGENKYTPMHLIARMLKVKSNLLVEFKTENAVHLARILDPLGNSFASCWERLPFNELDTGFYINIKTVADILHSRILFLHSMKRVGSKQVEGEVPPIPDEAEFFALAREQAEVFHDLVHADHTRFMGNLSFRCENGFPSFRGNDNMVYVSKRNIDKRDINKDGFVPVLRGTESGEGEVFYFGEHKPSVDTPIQLWLYNHLPNINYMIHSHVYVDGAAMTDSVLPCGAVNEAQAIAMYINNPDTTKFAINLRGHGSIVAGQTVNDLRGYKFIPREIPEKQTL
jgi:ribulose-5-phosphate 4-epimerase/fuculose-1-phosphate aldolase